MSCIAKVALLLPAVLTGGFRVKPRAGAHGPLHDRRLPNNSVAANGTEAAAPQDDHVAENGLAELKTSQDVRAALANRASLDRTLANKDVWKIPASETGYGNSGPYEQITRCRQELADIFPTSLWRHRASPDFQMEAVLDIPADLVSPDGVTNNCSQPYAVNVYYPVGASGPVPLISYAHGMNNGGTKMDEVERERIFQPLAEEGFFVIAYQHGGTRGYCSENHNQLGQIEWLKNSSYASMIDFSKIGVMGHSMGGKATWRSTTVGNADIKAAVSFNAHCLPHDCPVPAVPTLIISGNLDTTARPEQQRGRFNRMTVPGVFAGMAMGHGFNAEWSRLALMPLVMSWVRCHLLDVQEACSEINERTPLENTCFGTTRWTEASSEASSLQSVQQLKE